MGAVKYKYTDEQVAGDWDPFFSLANQYVKNYDGGFDLLLQYRARVLAGYDLTVPMVRATLNCMQHDARVVNLPQPQGPKNNVVPFPGRGVSFLDYREVGRRAEALDAAADRTAYADDEDEVQPLPPRPRRIKMVAKWKRDYVMSSNSAAYVIHRIHPGSHIEWNRDTGEQKPRVYWRCQAGAHQGVRTPIIFMDALEASILLMQRNRVEFRGNHIGEYVTHRRYLKLCKTCRELSGGK